MSGTALDHRLVRDYLREFDTAMRGMPPAQACELREQITAHLDDALQPGADDQEVAAALSRLGSPADLAAEAAAGARPLAAAAASGVGDRLARVRGRTWIVAGVAVVLTGIAVGYLYVFLTAGALQAGGVAAWWYPQDYRREVNVTANGTTQSTVPIRSGQRQGYVVGIYNPTNVTQTIVGDASGPDRGWDSPGGETGQIGVSAPNRNIDNGGFTRNVSYTLPGSIPPHQTRLVRVFWTSVICLGKGTSSGIDQLYLRVRVGWFTRTETIQLTQGWYLAGPSQGRCA